MIVLDLRRHPTALADANKAYAEATSSSVKFLIAENEHMVKDLQATRKREEQPTWSTMAEMRKMILTKASTLEKVMWKMYDRFVTVHKAFVHLHGYQQW